VGRMLGALRGTARERYGFHFAGSEGRKAKNSRKEGKQEAPNGGKTQAIGRNKSNE